MQCTPQIRELIRMALSEDLGHGDITAWAVPAERKIHAKIIAREDLTVAGLFLLPWIRDEARASLEIAPRMTDGASVTKDGVIVEISGNARELLSLERSFLNFLQRMSGVATLARAYKNAVGSSPVRVVDTRKTIPGWRPLDKEAVRLGGLQNHRFGLDSGILIKENHIRAAGSITKAITSLRIAVPHLLKIEVEVTNLQEAKEAIQAGAEILLLDNFAPAELPAVVKQLRTLAPGIYLEASGGVNLHTVRQIAESGVDCISVGALTHSAPAANLSLLCDFT
jgi:nicotinate-nucleotide pyrophosphorylase (carboxylating)